MSGVRVPVERQHEPADCALACLAMIVGYWQPGVRLRTLRGRFASGAQGTALPTLMRWAEQLGLQPRALRVSLKELSALRTPCILHWDLNHFVVLERVRRQRVWLVDPALGRRVLTLQACNTHFSGVALELEPTDQLTAPDPAPRLSLRRLLGGLRRHSGALGLIAALSVVLQVLLLAGPLYLQFVIDHVLTRGDLTLLQVLVLGFAALLLLEVLIQGLRGTALVQLSTDLGRQLGERLFARMLQTRPDYFARRSLGDLLSRFQSIEPVRELLAQGVISGAIDALLALVTAVLLLIYSPLLAGIVLVACLAQTALRAALFPTLRAHSQALIAAEAQVDTHFLETLRSFVPIKLLQQEGDRFSHWAQQRSHALGEAATLGRWRVGESATLRLINGSEHLVLIYCGALAVNERVLTIGMLLAFLSYRQRFAQAWDGLLDLWLRYRMLGVHRERLADLALAPAESRSPGCSVSQRASAEFIAGARLEARDLSFRYGDDAPWVLAGLNLHAAPGESLGLSGPSGCGKSTLVSLLLGLESPSAGVVLYDGRPLREVADFRRTVAAVMQDDALLSGSLADNICAFAAQPDLDRIARSAQLADVHDAIMTLPMQYQTPVGELGRHLSGGQRQRVLLARALYRRPRLLLLDEATSHLDAASEARICSRLAALPMTRIIIAHRAQTLAACDRVLMLPGPQARTADAG